MGTGMQSTLDELGFIHFAFLCACFNFTRDPPPDEVVDNRLFRKWHLIDPTTGKLFSNFDRASYPTKDHATLDVSSQILSALKDYESMLWGDQMLVRSLPDHSAQVSSVFKRYANALYDVILTKAKPRVQPADILTVHHLVWYYRNSQPDKFYAEALEVGLSHCLEIGVST